MSKATKVSQHQVRPFEWTRSKGVMQMRDLREYARWLFPKLGAKWEAQGVVDFTQKEDPEDDAKRPEPYQFLHNSGVVMTRDVKHLQAYVEALLKPFSEKNPHEFKSLCLLVFVPEFKVLHAHFNRLLSLRERGSSSE